MSCEELDFYTAFAVVGNKIGVKGVKDGQRVKTKIAYQPSFYVPTNQESQWKTVDGRNLMQHQCSNISEYYEKTKQYDKIGNFMVYGSSAHGHSFIHETWPGEIDFDISKILVYYVDIEVATKGGFSEAHEATQPITAITVYNSLTKRFMVYGCGEYKSHREDIVYQKFGHENQLLSKFLTDWENDDPDVVTSWNGKIFDVPYLVNRIARTLGLEEAKRMSPWKQLREKTEWILHQDMVVYEIGGVSQLDLLLLYKKNVLKPRESYSLNSIAEIELGTKKLDYSEYANLQDLYERDFQKFVEYNIVDVELLIKLNAKLKLLELQYYTAYSIKINFEEVFSQVKTWEVSITNYLMDQDIIVPPKTVHGKGEAGEGAYVMAPELGRHNWIVSFDINSLYPSIIRCINIGAETLLLKVPHEVKEEYADVDVENLLAQKYNSKVLADNTVAVAANGVFYDMTQPSFFSKMLAQLGDDRNKYKKSAIKGKQVLEMIKTELASRTDGNRP